MLQCSFFGQERHGSCMAALARAISPRSSATSCMSWPTRAIPLSVSERAPMS